MLVVLVSADVSELNLNNNDHHHNDQSQDEAHSQVPAQDEAQTSPSTQTSLEHDSKALEDIKFSLQVIMRELTFLSSIPAFKTLQESIHSRTNVVTYTDRKPEINDDGRVLLNEPAPDIPTDSTPASDNENVTLENVMSTVNTMLTELSTLMEPKASSPDPSVVPAAAYPVPEVQLAPPFSRLQATPFATILDSYWLKDDYRTPEASQKIFVAISPVVRHSTATVTSVSRRSKRAAGWPFIHPINPQALNDELLGKTLFRREISNENGYNYDKPSINFETSATNQEYLPPLEPAAANNINSLLQPFDKETGYEYKRPEKIFELPSSTARIIATTPRPITPRPTTTTRRTTKTQRPTPARVISTTPKAEYLPPREPAASNIEETGYKYPRPQVSFPEFQPSASNGIPSTVRPTERTTAQTVRPTEPTTPRTPRTTGYSYPRPAIKFEASASNQEYLPPLEPAPANNINSLLQPFDKETGYEYKKPEKIFSLPSSTTTVKIITPRPTTTTRRPTTTTTRRTTTTPRPTPARVVSTTPKVEYLPPREPAASNVQETGYKYPRPQVSFPLQPSASNGISSTVRPTSPSTARTTRPTEPTTRRPIQTTGYNYPKPAKQIVASTTTERYLPPLETSNSDGGRETIEYPQQKFDPEKGYDYSRPSKPFELPLEPDNTNESPVFEYPQQPFNEETGYEYAKPSIKFEIAKDYLPPSSIRSQDYRQGRQLDQGSVNVNDRLNPLTRLSADLKKLTSTVH